MNSAKDDLSAGFPHSEICGSKPVCWLPAAYRKLLRPSSPVIAKASTICTYSLDPITLPPRLKAVKSRYYISALVTDSARLGQNLVNAITTHASTQTAVDTLTSSKLLKNEQPIGQRPKGSASIEAALAFEL